MSAFPRLSIRAQLISIILMSTILSLLAGFGVVVTYDILTFRRDMVEQTVMTARIIGDYSVSDLAFEDRFESAETLSKLEAVPSVHGAFLYDIDGKLFSSYNKAGTDISIPPIRPTEVEFQGGYLHVFQPVTYRKIRYGTIYLCASTEPLKQKIAQYLGTMVLITVVLTAAAFSFAYKLQGLISKPILKLEGATRRFSETGDYSIRVGRSREDEIGMLYQGFNNMLEQIQHREEERDRAEDKLHRQQEKLRRYAAELERSNDELEQFAYIASHDLQEPLRKVQAFGERLTLKYSGALGEQGLDYLGRMNDAAKRMRILITDLLAYSRVTSRAQPFVPVDLNKVVKEVLSDLEIRIEQKKGRVEAGPLPTLDADPTQMRQLLQNLIGNSLKFHRENEPPVVRLHGGKVPIMKEDPRGRVIEEDWVRLTVEDNGIGFDEKYLDRIFTVFQRLHARTVYGGTGIGLAICRKIVERHGGTITARSSPGRGANFIVSMPMRQMGERHDEEEKDADHDPDGGG